MLIVVAYDPTWPQRLQAASAEILAVADHLFLRLEHIGSTSVPGLAAKPTIDMMASVRRLLDGHAAQPALAALGYELDELGYVQLDPRGAELLFQIITEREERASIAIGTNLPFSEWGNVFPDPASSPAIVDRITFNAHIIETGTQSYRLATSKTSNRKRAS